MATHQHQLPRHTVIAALKTQVHKFEGRLRTNQQCLTAAVNARSGLVENGQYKTGLNSVSSFAAALDAILMVQVSTMEDNIKELSAALDQLRDQIIKADSPILTPAPGSVRLGG